MESLKQCQKYKSCKRLQIYNSSGKTIYSALRKGAFGPIFRGFYKNQPLVLSRCQESLSNCHQSTYQGSNHGRSVEPKTNDYKWG